MAGRLGVRAWRGVAWPGRDARRCKPNVCVIWMGSAASRFWRRSDRRRPPNKRSMRRPRVSPATPAVRGVVVTELLIRHASSSLPHTHHYTPAPSVLIHPSSQRVLSRCEQLQQDHLQH